MVERASFQSLFRLRLCANQFIFRPFPKLAFTSPQCASSAAEGVRKTLKDPNMKPGPIMLDPNPTKLAIRLGGWFEAYATGWGVVAVLGVVALLVTFAALPHGS